MKTISMPVEEYEAELKKAHQSGLSEGQRYFAEYLERAIMTRDRLEPVKNEMVKFAKDNKAFSTVERVDRVLDVIGITLLRPNYLGIVGDKNGKTS